MTETNYVNGMPHGLRTVWNEDGSIKSETNYKNGELIDE
jgi:antitoxin component YwqK of YwqJK toxin-antitoxin module